MILTVTLNAALDVTYFVDEVTPHTTHRVERTVERAGGKGINVARVLTTLGHPVFATGLAGGRAGQLIRDDLRASGVRDALVPVRGESRRTVTVVCGRRGDATVFNEPGPTVDPRSWTAFTRRFTELARRARVVVLAGSLPPGLPSDAYAELVATARAAGAVTVLDTSGPALLAALDAHPDVIKPNAAEILEATRRSDLAQAAAELQSHGARTVIASAGPEGLYALTPEGHHRVRPPALLRGNPTGAGDACVAALAAGLAAGLPWPDVLRDAVALSAAAAAAPLAGDFRRDLYDRFRTTVTMETPRAPDGN
ncbi:1-phosphofructokinase family hexose kinase [Streptomyces sp. H27-H1]|uniref:1-phosphofructokinase family hexose kinase n=1 Tax=Streptomyces sp. H27-H1 TaxID=2996461 RepID=UPI00226E9002|nr:1-phosphofructokinase family hexose kinase [Streptomyces sp. H27-H1]MCY0931783.1 1-phosphofructokinase family hexose kinase [Streptomyces sp. H27-H1]